MAASHPPTALVNSVRCEHGFRCQVAIAQPLAWRTTSFFASVSLCSWIHKASQRVGGAMWERTTRSGREACCLSCEGSKQKSMFIWVVLCFSLHVASCENSYVSHTHTWNGAFEIWPQDLLPHTRPISRVGVRLGRRVCRSGMRRWLRVGCCSDVAPGRRSVSKSGGCDPSVAPEHLMESEL